MTEIRAACARVAARARHVSIDTDAIPAYAVSVGAQVDGETWKASLAALERLDYGRLLAEVDRAKLSAEERVAYSVKVPRPVP